MKAGASTHNTKDQQSSKPNPHNKPQAKQADSKQNNLGITVKKQDDSSEWYTQVIQKAELIEYTDVSGCMVLRPRSYGIWEKVQRYMDDRLQKIGVRNAYFPMLIPKSLLLREKEHVEGFSPEVAWVTKGGNSPLAEELAIRPTSETIMYDSYKKWIRSHRDLPLRLNQWCNVVRWEFKNPVPFLRTREFLWQEGHTVFATKQEADKEVREILNLYAEVMEELYAVPVLKGMKSESEKFAGALYTTSLETFFPNGKAIQVATSHCLGQNFAKAFDITFLDENSQPSHPWQNSWGITTRTIGIMILMHGDDRGLIVPPRLAYEKGVIVPIIFGDSKELILSACRKLADELRELGIILDDRDEYSSGWKFNEWELKGIPLRIEMGPKDLQKEQVVIVRRDTGEKQFVPLADVKKKIPELLDTIQKNLYEKAKAHMDANTVFADSFEKVKKAVEEKKLVLMPWSGEGEDRLKEELSAKTLNIPFDQSKFQKGAKCALTGKPATCVVYVAKSY